jgi:UDP-N-acetylglucosamine acyltransferase
MVKMYDFMAQAIRDKFYYTLGETKIHCTSIQSIDMDVSIGNGVYIGPHCTIGYDPEIRGYVGNKASVILHDRVRICGHVTIDAGSKFDTIIFDECMLMKHVHIGHDAIIHKDVTISPGAKIGGHAVICKYTTIGMNATIHQYTCIPAGCMIGMSAIMVKKESYKAYRKYINNGVELGINYKVLEKLGISHEAVS